MASPPVRVVHDCLLDCLRPATRGGGRRPKDSRASRPVGPVQQRSRHVRQGLDELTRSTAAGAQPHVVATLADRHGAVEPRSAATGSGRYLASAAAMASAAPRCRRRNARRAEWREGGLGSARGSGISPASVSAIAGRCRG